MGKEDSNDPENPNYDKKEPKLLGTNKKDYGRFEDEPSVDNTVLSPKE